MIDDRSAGSARIGDAVDGSLLRVQCIVHRVPVLLPIAQALELRLARRRTVIGRRIARRVEPSEHVVEGAVLQHEYNEVLDLVQWVVAHQFPVRSSE